jgi:hypothetical protein
MLLFVIVIKQRLSRFTNTYLHLDEGTVSKYVAGGKSPQIHSFVKNTMNYLKSIGYQCEHIETTDNGENYASYHFVPGKSGKPTYRKVV